jgi:solute carrier family 26 (sodium-independent sulfate anion transporter), member 11
MPSGCFVYFIFGSCKDITIGPTAILSLLTYTVVSKLNADLAVLTTFLSGCIIFTMGFFNLGFLMQFLSTSTILGFMNAATVTIVSGQIRRLLGIKSGSSSEFIDSWEALFNHYDETKLYDTILGVSSLLVLVGIRKLSQMNRKSILLRYLSISRNAIVVFGGILIAYLFHKNGIEPFNLTGDIASGFPSISLPPFSTVHNNETYTFTEMVSSLGLSIVSVPVISIIEAVAIAKSFSKGKIVDVTQEMCALGLCNIASSFFTSIPITGSFTRSAVNHASGVQTTLGGIFTGAVVLLSLGVLTKTFFFIPKTSLAAVIIAAMFTMMEWKKVIEIYRTKRIDVIPFLGTFLVSLWQGLEIGIVVGVGLNVLITLYNTSRPEIAIEQMKVSTR